MPKPSPWYFQGHPSTRHRAGQAGLGLVRMRPAVARPPAASRTSPEKWIGSEGFGALFEGVRSPWLASPSLDLTLGEH